MEVIRGEWWLWLMAMLLSATIYGQTTLDSLVLEFGGSPAELNVERDSIIRGIETPRYCWGNPPETLVPVWIYRIGIEVRDTTSLVVSEEEMRKMLRMAWTSPVYGVLNKWKCKGSTVLLGKQKQRYLGYAVILDSVADPCTTIELSAGIHYDVLPQSSRAKAVIERYEVHGDLMVFNPEGIRCLINASWMGCIDKYGHLRWFHSLSPEQTYSTEEMTAEGWKAGRRLILQWYPPNE